MVVVGKLPGPLKGVVDQNESYNFEQHLQLKQDQQSLKGGRICRRAKATDKLFSKRVIF
jgi:hypothetical protein